MRKQPGRAGSRPVLGLLPVGRRLFERAQARPERALQEPVSSLALRLQALGVARRPSVWVRVRRVPESPGAQQVGEWLRQLRLAREGPSVRVLGRPVQAEAQMARVARRGLLSPSLPAGPLALAQRRRAGVLVPAQALRAQAQEWTRSPLGRQVSRALAVPQVLILPAGVAEAAAIPSRCRCI
ncbi:MAG: hypothetical protein FJ388_02335 [Verrucomicrobia bacterium]|nr:hypothetical protein [Verrucomicrobiota bacterium]